MSAPSAPIFLFRLLLAILSLTSPASGQDTSIINPTTAAPSATPLPSAKGYTYAGCWNETVGVTGASGARALSGGMQVGGERSRSRGETCVD